MPDNLVAKLSEISKAVGAVAKGDRNQSQNFNFRGIDAVVNAVSAHLCEQGIIVVPYVIEQAWDEITTASGKRQAWVKVVVDYRFTDGKESVEARVVAEATDFADKATAKVMSVAFRTALLQVLHLPTDDPDPDSEYVERGSPASSDLEKIKGLLKSKKVDPADVKLKLAELGDYTGLSEVSKAEDLAALLSWAEEIKA